MDRRKVKQNLKKTYRFRPSTNNPIQSFYDPSGPFAPIMVPWTTYKEMMIYKHKLYIKRRNNFNVLISSIKGKQKW